MQSDLVIVVDDDDELRNLLGDILTTDEFRVLDFNSPHAALKEIRSGSIHGEIAEGHLPIIVSDNLMPGGMTGLEFLKEVRKEYPGIPFVFMTAFGGDEICRKSKEFGATSFLQKPFSLADLQDHLMKAKTVLKSAPEARRGFS